MVYAPGIWAGSPGCPLAWPRLTGIGNSDQYAILNGHKPMVVKPKWVIERWLHHIGVVREGIRTGEFDRLTSLYGECLFVSSFYCAFAETDLERLHNCEGCDERCKELPENSVEALAERWREAWRDIIPSHSYNKLSYYKRFLPSEEKKKK